MLTMAHRTLFKIPVNRIGKWFFWIVVGCVIALFIIGFGYVVHDVLDVLSGNKPIFDILNTGERNAHIEIMFDHTQDWLSRRAKAFGISYYAINLIVYVLAMPLLCIGSYLVLHFRKPAPARA